MSESQKVLLEQTQHDYEEILRATSTKTAGHGQRVTPKDLADNIASEHYFTAGDAVDGQYAEGMEPPHHQSLDLLTFCVLVLRNGFTVTGESACASPENFDAELGRKIARENAVNKVWPLMGYLLKQCLYDMNAAGPTTSL